MTAESTGAALSLCASTERPAPVLALVIPCFNEATVLAGTAPLLLDALARLVTAGSAAPESYLVLVDDGSVDDTWATIGALAAADRRVRGVRLSRNCGQQAALMAGLDEVRGACDAAVTLDADGQDDPAALAEMVETTCCVERAESGRVELPVDELVVGDVVHLSSGDLVPADLRLIFSRDLFVSQSALTGESESVEKHRELSAGDAASASVTDLDDLAFLGSSVISGAATGVVVATGAATLMGEAASGLTAAVYAGESLAASVEFACALVRHAMQITPDQPDYQVRGVSFESVLGDVTALLS